MHALLRRLKRTEEGQALVLAAICGLILAVCVIATVNIGHAVYEKVQLQDAADNAAYSQAAMEARAMNFMAYSNRAMVVHYASIMVWVAWLSYLTYLDNTVGRLLRFLRVVPYIGIIFYILGQIIKYALQVYSVVAAIAIPLLGALNLILYLLQWGMRFTTFARLGGNPPELAASDKGARDLAIGGAVGTGAINAKEFLDAFDLKSELGLAEAVFAPFVPGYLTGDTQLARAHMVEVANSARHPWVVDDHNDIPILGRKWYLGINLGFVDADLHKYASTELFMYAPRRFSFGSIGTHDEVFSNEDLGMKLQILGGLVEFTADYFTDARSTLGFGSGGAGGLAKRETFTWDCELAWGFVPCKKLVKKSFLGAIIDDVGKVAKGKWQTNQPMGALGRFLGITPYAVFKPQAHWRNRGTPLIGGDIGHFGQPDVLMAVGKDTADLDFGPANNAMTRSFGLSFGGSAGGKADFKMKEQPGGSVGALLGLRKGLNALSAAGCYYHRPGVWKEQPNLFNPLWGAKLMPVAESEAGHRLGLDNGLLAKFLLH